VEIQSATPVSRRFDKKVSARANLAVRKNGKVEEFFVTKCAECASLL